MISKQFLPDYLTTTIINIYNFVLKLLPFLVKLLFQIASRNVTNIKLTVTGNSIKVAWDLPQCSANIKEIKVQYRKKGQITWPLQVKTASPSDKEITIKGLENGVEYEVRVVAVDIGGREHKTEAPGAIKIGIYSKYYYV